MIIADAALETLGSRYQELLELTPFAARLLGDPALARELQLQYATTRFVKVPDILPPQALAAVTTGLQPIFRLVGEQVALRQEPDAVRRLSDGARFRRIDPVCLGHPDSRAKMSALLEHLGVVGFASILARKLAPLIRLIAGVVHFDRPYFYLYGEGDYISAHDDHHVGQRVDVQFPVTTGSVGGVRVLADGFLRMHYDTTGSMNVLGPCMWHDVPPLLRIDASVDPQRIVFGLRFLQDA